jgi:hypothetical protein
MHTTRTPHSGTGPRRMSMPTRHLPHRATRPPGRDHAWTAAAALAGACLLAGCASTGIDSQWADPELSKRSLAGAKVLVVCQAADLSVRLVCGDQMAAQVKALGAVPLLQQNTADAGMAPVVSPERDLVDARAAGASALFNTQIAPETVAVNPGPQFSIGLGGFGGSRGSGGGVGVGVAAPIGGASASTGYSASGAITDVASGRLMWSAKANAPPSSDVNQQLASLAKTLLESARSAGLFPR